MIVVGPWLLAAGRWFPLVVDGVVGVDFIDAVEVCGVVVVVLLCWCCCGGCVLLLLLLKLLL